MEYCTDTFFTTCSACPNTATGNACVKINRECPIVSSAKCVPNPPTDSCGKNSICMGSQTISNQDFTFTYDASFGDGKGNIAAFSGYSLPSTVTGTISIKSTNINSVKIIPVSPPFFDNAAPTTVVFDNVLPINMTLPKSVTRLEYKNCKLPNFDNLYLGPGVTTLILEGNNRIELPDVSKDAYARISNLEWLDLSKCNLEKVEWKFPSTLKTLSLANNGLTSIPNGIFSLNLTLLSLSKNRISNTPITQEQANALKAIATFTMDPLTASCDQTAVLEKINSEVSLCMVKPPETSSNLGLIIGCSVGGVVVLALIAFFFCRKKSFRDPRNTIAYRSTHTPNRTLSNRSGNRSDRNFFGGNNSNNRTNPGPFVRKSDLARPSDLRPTNSTASGWGHLTNPSISTAGFGQVDTNNKTNQSTISAGDGLNPAIPLLHEEDMTYTRVLGSGAKGIVWLASYAGEICAVKRLVENSQDRDEALGSLIVEANLLYRLQHPRIIELYGTVQIGNAIALVMEFMDQGDLFDCLQKRKGQPSQTFTWAGEKGTYALHIAEGLASLHQRSPPLIHRDIKARNILIDSRKGAKICDFGESRSRTFEETMTSNVGTARWIAPEVLMNEDYSEKADIYSFGVLLSELDTHNIPYSDAKMDERQIMQLVAVNRLRPTFTSECPERIQHLARACMQADPMLRPDAARVVRSIMEIMSMFVSL